MNDVFPGASQVIGNSHGSVTELYAIVQHQTYSPTFGSAFNAILGAGTSQFLIGKTEAEGTFEFMGARGLAYHCNGANFYAFGIENHSVGGEDLTPYQVRMNREIVQWARSVFGVPLVYVDPESTPWASIWVNGGTFHGNIAHRQVQPDDNSSQHTDCITMGDWNLIATAPALVPTEDDMVKGKFFRTQGDPAVYEVNPERGTKLHMLSMGAIKVMVDSGWSESGINVIGQDFLDTFPTAA